MPSSFLRVRFDRSDEIRRHFHLVEDRVLFFYPYVEASLREGARVALEVGFSNSDQVCTARGAVTSVSEEPRGVWLAFPRGSASGIEEALRSPKRRHRRIFTNLLVNVSRTPTVSHLARLLDVSPTSARLGDTSVSTGDLLWLRVLGAVPQMPGELGPARVTWVRSGEAGVRFLNGSIGRAIAMNLVLRMDELWASTKNVNHATWCPCDKDCPVHEPVPWPALTAAPTETRSAPAA